MYVKCFTLQEETHKSPLLEQEQGGRKEEMLFYSGKARQILNQEMKGNDQPCVDTMPL